MKFDEMTLGPKLGTVASEAQQAESRGLDAWLTAEIGHDAMLLAALAAEHTERVEIGTGIAVAFARNPMTMAYQANDVQQLSEGRFVLGLGSQIEPHITRRFSMPWSSPAARMREYVQALHAIWDVWQGDSERLEFRGEFYQHTLMTPFFAPSPHGYGRPKVALAAVGPLMTRVAGEVADIFLAHGFTTDAYLRDRSLPGLREAAQAAGRDPRDIEVALPVFAITGYSGEEAAGNETFVRSQIAFYGSTPAYRPVLDVHGWGELQPELNALSKRGRWDEMARLVTDEMLEAFAVRCEPSELGTRIRERYGDLADRVSLYSGFRFADDQWSDFLRDLRGS